MHTLSKDSASYMPMKMLGLVTLTDHLRVVYYYELSVTGMLSSI